MFLSVQFNNITDFSFSILTLYRVHIHTATVLYENKQKLKLLIFSDAVCLIM